MKLLKLLPVVLLMCSNALAMEKKVIAVKLEAPDSAWKIDIKQVRKVGNEIWVISKLSRNPDAIGLQVISVVRDRVVVKAPNLPQRHFIVGKTWSWGDGGAYTFLRDLRRIRKDLNKGRVLYKAR